MKLSGKGAIDEFRNGKFPRLKPDVANVGVYSEGALGEEKSAGGEGEGEGERRAPMGGGPGAKGMDLWGSRWLVSEDKINSADGVHSAAQEARRIEKGQM